MSIAAPTAPLPPRGSISPNRPIVARMVRALDHSGYRNPLSLPKIDAAGRVLAVTMAEVEPGQAAAPGTVLEATPAGLVVACATGAVRLAGLRAMDGSAICPSTLGITHLPRSAPTKPPA
jgi:methionyl-tRNA formyltransferase